MHQVLMHHACITTVTEAMTTAHVEVFNAMCFQAVRLSSTDQYYGKTIALD